MFNKLVRQVHSKRTGPINLICFAHAGGGTSRFHSWASELEGLANIFVPVLPGREERLMEPALPKLESVIDEIIPHVELILNRPIVLAGISYGALLAYECAVRLHQKGVDLKALLVASQRSPTQTGCLQSWFELPDEFLIQNLVRLGGLDEEMICDPDIGALFLAAIRADLEASETYLPQNKSELDCPIFAWRGVEDSVISEKDNLGWKGKTSNHVDFRNFEAGHFLLNEQEDIWLMAIKKELAILSESLSVKN